MTRSTLIIGLIVMLSVTIGGPGLLATSAQAEMMEADMAMMKATAIDLMALKMEIATLQAELQRIAARAATMTKMVDKAASDYCASVPIRSWRPDSRPASASRKRAKTRRGADAWSQVRPPARTQQAPVADG
jgi:hypothetical protein